MECRICAKKQHYCHNCGYDEDLAPFAHGYCGWEHFIEGYDKLLAYEKKYYLLIMAVGTKHPNETRHQTALRYILEAEMGDSSVSQDA